MTVTVSRVVGLDDLGLTVIAGAAGLDSVVRWVHVSEMADPRPWLRGGELLLTTGLQIADPAGHYHYIERLASAQIAGLGVGVGVVFSEVPASIAAVADRLGLCVISVPTATPYLAISEAVSEMLTEERAEAGRRAFDAQQALIRAALAGSTHEMVAELARLICGDVVHTDISGQPVAASSARAAAMADGLQLDLARLREAGGVSSFTVADGSTTTVIQPLSVDRMPRGFLIARSVTGGEYERMVISAGVGLLTLEVERSRTASIRLQRIRASTLAGMLTGSQPMHLLVRQLNAWHLDPGSLRVLIFIAPRATARSVYEGVVALLAEDTLAGAAVLEPEDGQARVCILTTDDPQGLTRVEELTRSSAGGALGISGPGTAETLATSKSSALRAARLGRSEHRAVTHFNDLAALELLFFGTQPDARHAFVSKVLGTLSATKGGSREALWRRTLRVYLTSNGNLSTAATDLGVHRHTLSARLERIEEATGRRLGSPYDRMELWLALMTEELDG